MVGLVAIIVAIMANLIELITKVIISCRDFIIIKLAIIKLKVIMVWVR